MRFSAVAAAALSLAAGVSAGYGGYSNASYVTEVVTAYTTYCPEPTVITHNNVTYTVTAATTLTITDCPCTITKPVVSVATYTSCSHCKTHAPPPPKNVTTSTYQVASTAYPTAAATFTGAANKAFAASGAGLAGLVGLAAYIL